MSEIIKDKENEAELSKEELEEQLKNLPVMAELMEEAEEYEEDEDEEDEEEELLDEDYSREDGEEESLDELLKRINNREFITEKAGEFTIATDIGKKDYRDFFYYNTLMKSNVFLAIYILIPFLLSYLFTGLGGTFDLVNFIIYAVVFALLEAGLIIFMTELKIKKIEKAMPDTMKVTRTVYKFVSDGIVHTKNGETTKAFYKDIVLFRTTKQKVILYFANKKAMVIHIDDIEKVMTFEEFKTFIKAKAY